MTPVSVPLEVLQRVAVNATEIRPGDREILTAQLGRDPRGLVGIGARCVCGAPAVTITYPRLPDGSPFPTLFYLSYPWLVREISRIESAGEMATYNKRLAEDPQYAAAHAQAHESYVARRDLLMKSQRLLESLLAECLIESSVCTHWPAMRLPQVQGCAQLETTHLRKPDGIGRYATAPPLTLRIKSRRERG